jgi:hypothetical protein
MIAMAYDHSHQTFFYVSVCVMDIQKKALTCSKNASIWSPSSIESFFFWQSLVELFSRLERKATDRSWSIIFSDPFSIIREFECSYKEEKSRLCIKP